MEKPERWLPIPIPEYENFYLVSDLGNVRRDGAERPLKGRPDKRGRMRVNLCVSGVAVDRMIHKLVMLAFVGPCPSGKEVNHINGKNFDNRLSNLEYITPNQNTDHAKANGLYQHGDNHYSRRNPKLVARGNAKPNAKLSPKDVKKIRQLIALPSPHILNIAKAFGVSTALIYKIKKGIAWPHVS